MEKRKYFFLSLFILISFIGSGQDLHISPYGCNSLKVSFQDLDFQEGKINLEKEINKGTWLKINRVDFSEEKKIYKSLPKGNYRVSFMISPTSKYYSNELFLECKFKNDSELDRKKDINTSSEVAKNAFMLFPNPVHDVLHVRVSSLLEDSDNYTYNICTLDGREVQAGKLGAGTNILDSSMLQSGVYILKILSSDQLVESFRIVKS
ncbi:MAG: T9SS type A sorting domain-containing protein [Chitinophagales bacterium]|nr:T9SS type A sorting domain-containing protein [Chitinophagales bacterium]